MQALPESYCSANFTRTYLHATLSQLQMSTPLYTQLIPETHPYLQNDSLCIQSSVHVHTQQAIPTGHHAIQ
jgi:hypothetical protein